ncbi:TPA: diguanylate cyclase, partial [Enterobacter roggenkampii]|nr:diguanylate cyclase [Enterobacter hormaechei]HEM8824721.1 diguanylate cyclase [Raoultella planticola]MCG0535529.1 diguanylate cyclase [Enterobacter hormaechei]MCG0549645.1 diguanylate cyclase [Enterobacter hormaechei]MCG0554282.1 diguanylate cyclase [Enterobacter hormaechei]
FLLACLGGPLKQAEGIHLTSLKKSLDKRITGEYQLGEKRVFYPGASVGVIEINPKLTDAEGALQAADEAMYHVKKHKEKKPFIRLD